MSNKHEYLETKDTGPDGEGWEEIACVDYGARLYRRKLPSGLRGDFEKGAGLRVNFGGLNFCRQCGAVVPRGKDCVCQIRKKEREARDMREASDTLSAMAKLREAVETAEAAKESTAPNLLGHDWKKELDEKAAAQTTAEAPEPRRFGGGDWIRVEDWVEIRNKAAENLDAYRVIMKESARIYQQQTAEIASLQNHLKQAQAGARLSKRVYDNLGPERERHAKIDVLNEVLVVDAVFKAPIPVATCAKVINKLAMLQEISEAGE